MDQKEFSFKDLLSVPFVIGGTDCWWLAREVFKRFGKELPEYAVSREEFNCDLGKMPEMIERKKADWTETEKPVVPCLVVMMIGLPFYHHLGVYIGDNKFIHTSKLRGMVTIEDLDNLIYGNRKFYTFNGN